MNKSNRAKGILYSAGTADRAVERYFTTLSAQEIFKYFPDTAGHRFFRQRVFADGPMPMQHFALRDEFNIEFEKCLAWARGIFRLHAGDVQCLLDSEASVQDSILQGTAEGALRVLDEIDSKYGFSLRSIVLRSSVLSYFGMQSERQEFLSTLLSDPRSRSNRLLRLFLSSLPRHDPLAAQLEFHDQREQGILKAVPRPISSLLIYKLVPYKALGNYRDDDIAPSLVNTSLYDLISYFLDAARRAVARNEKGKLPHFLPFLREANRYYPSPAFTALLEAVDPQGSYNFVPSAVRIFDCYTEGRYEETIDLYLRDSNNRRHFSLFLVAAKAAARVRKNPFDRPLANICTSLGHIFRKDIEFQRHAAELKSICQLFPGVSWFFELECLIDAETSSLLSPTRKTASHALLAVSDVNTPFRAQVLPTSGKKTFHQECDRLCHGSSTASLFSTFASDSSPSLKEAIDPQRKKMYEARTLIRNGAPADALSLLQELLLTNDPVTEIEAFLTYIQALFEAKRTNEALFVTLERICSNPKLLFVIDVQSVYQAAETELQRRPSTGIAVLFSLYSKHIDDKYDPQLAYCFERVLETAGCISPIEYAKKSVNKEDMYFVRFLMEVCVPQVMKSSLLFSSTSEIEEERIDLCNFMLSVGIADRTSLEQEVKDRTRRLVLKTASRQVDGSKIYADIEHSKHQVKLKALELFDRYVLLSKNDYSGEQDEQQLRGIVHTLSAGGLMEKLHSVFLVGVQLNEKNAAFLKLTKAVRDDFVFGDKGLNSYLSTRIRHGHILTTLRRSPQAEELITQRMTKDGRFVRNDYWLDTLNPQLESRLDAALTSCFSDFAKGFYETIDEISNEWLQVTILDTEIEAITQKKRTALFDFSITPAESFALQMACANSDDFDAFWDVTISWLWERTDANLREIQSKLRQEVRPRFSALFDELQKKVMTLVSNPHPLSLINNAIARAKEGLYTDLENVVSWFNRTDNNSIQEYSFDVAASIAARVCQIRNVKVMAENLSLAGRTLSPIVDILCIIFGNAVSYAKLPIDALSVEVTLESNDGRSVLTVTNSCSPVESTESANKSLEYLRETCAKEEIARDHYQKEGGTGFYKLGRILGRDLGTQYNMQFAYTASEAFVVSIEMKGLEVRDANSAGRG